MSPTTKSAVIFSMLFIITKLVLFNTGLHESNYILVVFANILFVLLAMIMGLRMNTKANPSEKNYTELVKISMRSAALYALLVSAFAYLYYTKIDPDFINSRVEERMVLARAADFDQLKKDHPEKLEGKNREDFLNDEKSNAELWFSPFFLSTLTLVGLILISLFYSFFIAWFWKKFLEKQFKTVSH